MTDHPQHLETRQLTYKLEMPLKYDEKAFRELAHAAIHTVAREFGGRSTGMSMSHGTLSRAEHYEALARHERERHGT